MGPPDSFRHVLDKVSVFFVKAKSLAVGGRNLSRRGLKVEGKRRFALSARPDRGMIGALTSCPPP